MTKKQVALVILNKVKDPVNSRYRNTKNDWMFQGFALQHDEEAGRTRHPEQSEGSSQFSLLQYKK